MTVIRDTLSKSGAGCRALSLQLIAIGFLDENPPEVNFPAPNASDEKFNSRPVAPP